MEQQLSELPVTFSDGQINDFLRDLSPARKPYTRHFTQSEEFMLRLPDSYTVDSCSIHHDVRRSRPGPDYLSYVRNATRQVARLLPDVFEGLTHLFDPAEIFRPAFFRLYRYESRQYLYLLRLDLQFRPTVHELITRGDNDTSSSYRSNVVILEADFIPLDGVRTENNRIRGFQIEQSVSETWIGETGRGYFVQGIWLDRDLTRFFSRVFIPPGVRTYPYYPFTCKYRSICHSVATLDEASRKRSLPLLHHAREYLMPHLREIEEVLRKDSNEVDSHPTFRRLRENVPPQWRELWDAFDLRVYLNSDDQKEFQLENGII